MKPTKFFGNLFFTNRFFLSWGVLILLFIVSYFVPFLFVIAQGLLFLITVLSLIDIGILFLTKNTLTVRRKVAEVFSNAELNIVHLQLQSSFRVPLRVTIIDELPYQFQQRDFSLQTLLKPISSQELQYELSPHERGEYQFGNIHLYALTALQFAQRRFTAEAETIVKVYPSFLQLRKFHLKAIPEMQASSSGQRQFRRGMSTEFDHIKEYTRGDDARAINWKASARRNQLMINSFMDEKSQQIYCLIDKGRLMKMPFDSLTLMDYSINASLMFSYVALQKDDKIGLITFGERVDEIVQPSKSKKQFNIIMETLYKQDTRFLESNYAALYQAINQRAGQRSLLLLFTNFETLTGFERQLPYLRVLNKKHLLCVVLFENTEVSSIHETYGDSIEDIYIKTIADKFLFEKKMIVRELHKNGILAIYTTPKKLTVDVVNKYLELKARQFI